MNKKILSHAFSRAFLTACALSVNATAQTPEVQRASGQLEEIFVTAQKKLESSQDIPIAMTVMTGEQLKNAGIASIKGLEKNTPNLSFSTSSDGSSSTAQAFVRGIGQFDSLATTDPGVAIYIDGVYQARTVGANMRFADIQNVAVLRGPQGTLFGKNTIGGAIDVTTKVPEGNASYTLDVTLGSDDLLDVNGYIEAPIVNETLSASFAFNRVQSSGWQSRTGQNAGDDDFWGGRTHLYWTPSDTFTSHLAVDGVWQEQSVYPRVLLAFDPDAPLSSLYNQLVAAPQGTFCCTPNSDIDRSQVDGDDDFDNLKAHGLSWSSEWDAESFILQSVTGYRHTNSDTRRTSDNTSLLDYQVNASNLNHDQFSQEFTFTGYALDDRLEWVAGVHYFEETSNHISNVVVGAGIFEALVDSGLNESLAANADFTLFYDRKQDTTSTAAYFHTTYNLSEDLSINLAGRITYEKKDLEVDSYKVSSQQPILAIGPTNTDSCSDITPSGVGSRYTCDESWSDFSPQIGLEWQVNAETLAYARVSRGFRSGVFNGRPTAAAQVSVADPEHLTSYEVGYKIDFADGHLRVNGAIFYNDYEDQQLLVNRASNSADNALSLVVDNAGESSMVGAELEFIALPMSGLTVTGAIGYLDPEFDEFDTLEADETSGELVVIDNTDRPFANTPELTANLALQYDHQLPQGQILSLRTDVTYKDDVFYSNDPDSMGFDLLHEDGFTTVDASIGLLSADDQWGITFRAVNLTDERNINGGFAVDAFGSVDASYTAPRRYLLSINYNGDFL